MTKILIIGANGQIARVATHMLLERTDATLTLYLRKAKRLERLAGDPRVRIVEGDATDQSALEQAMDGQEVVYANLAGDMARQARAIVAAMKAKGVRRLIFISSMGIYGEVPGEAHGSILDPYRDSAAVVEASGLAYTVIRPAWLNDDHAIAYGMTRKGETFVNPHATVSRRSVGDVIVRLIEQTGFGVDESLGIHAPCDGETPLETGGLNPAKGGIIMSQVIVVVGAGSIGQAIARRVGVGRKILLADLAPSPCRCGGNGFALCGL
jgi:uncharacterized protein YbjT (DUF2867 family)